MAYWHGGRRDGPGWPDPQRRDEQRTPTPVFVAILGTAALVAVFGLVGWVVGSVVVGMLLAVYRRWGRR